jgi:virginiamycin B lyase
MNRSGRRSRLAALLTAMFVCICLLSLSTAPAWAKVGTITEFPIPTAESDPLGITAGPDGNLWFTTPINRSGRITTGGSVTGFPIPTANSGLFGITAGPDGNLWFTEEFGNKIGRITTGGSATAFALPRTCQNKFGCQPFGITAGPDGNLWFTEFRGSKIGRITTQ